MSAAHLARNRAIDAENAASDSLVFAEHRLAQLQHQYQSENLIVHAAMSEVTYRRVLYQRAIAAADQADNRVVEEQLAQRAVGAAGQADLQVVQEQLAQREDRRRDHQQRLALWLQRAHAVAQQASAGVVATAFQGSGHRDASGPANREQESWEAKEDEDASEDGWEADGDSISELSEGTNSSPSEFVPNGVSRDSGDEDDAH